MNKQRRKELEKVQDAILGAITDLECIRDEEQEAFDNLPESLQYSEKGEYMEETISMIEDVLSDLESIDMDELCNR